MILYILDINKETPFGSLLKSSLVYMGVAIFSLLFGLIYNHYGHGVTSNAMTYLFVYPLAGGTVFYMIIKMLFPLITGFTGYRMFFNLYNSGLAALMAGSLLTGIVEIAGTESVYIKFFYYTGGGMILAGFMVLGMLMVNYKKIRHNI